MIMGAFVQAAEEVETVKVKGMEGSTKILDPELRRISERGSIELSKASGSEVNVSVITSARSEC